jgi:uncharacterized phage infection (PIP) family protein YhgE
MEAGTKQVDVGVTTTAKAGASLQEIITTSQKVGDMILQIAFSATEQTAAAEEINTNVDTIAKMAHESSAGAQQSAKACQELSNLALDLRQLVGRFNLDNTHLPRGTGEAKREEEKGVARLRASSAPISYGSDGNGALQNYQHNQLEV